ncbi:MAG: glycogen debranching protein GlgX [Anaerolineae bacterium]
MHSYHTRYGTLIAHAGVPAPFGAHMTPSGINFAISSAHATSMTLVLFGLGETEPFAEIPFQGAGMQTGNVFHMCIEGLNAEKLEYGYRLEGPNRPEAGHYFDPDRIVSDPYTRHLTGRSRWRKVDYPDSSYPMRSAIPLSQFNWGNDQPLNLPIEDLIIYEMHVRSFTAHPTVQVSHPGTYSGLIEKIPYLKDLGINCVELMPVQEFDEFESPFLNPESGEQLLQYWGYGTTAFYSPKAGYSSGQMGSHLDEFKAMVKALHAAGIEVWLDVVFNHTAEGNGEGHTISFRGIDNKTWYMLGDSDHHYLNYSGTGNTLNCNHPVVASMIVDCLRYWVTEFHIDGFRFDLASILTRGQDGTPLVRPPVVEAIALDPVLANTKLIAEAWDAAGLYQVGNFPHFNRWSEWNGRYRDNVRKFLTGDQGQTGGMVQRILGSPDLYKEEQGSADASINFITCHDGFTLRDLFSYDHKHNLANGEDNRDGGNDNNSWNCGFEGETDDQSVKNRRQKLARNAIVVLLLSRGVPLINMGDELWHTKQGNNNTWGQDNELNWLNWDALHSDKDVADIFRFFRLMIDFRKAHPALRATHFPSEESETESNSAEIVWHGVSPNDPDWAWHSHTLAFSFSGPENASTVYVAMNMHWEDHQFLPPMLASDCHWTEVVNTAEKSPADIYPLDNRAPFSLVGESILVEKRSITILISHHT